MEWRQDSVHAHLRAEDASSGANLGSSALRNDSLMVEWD